jgi:hypothetical protein
MKTDCYTYIGLFGTLLLHNHLGKRGCLGNFSVKKDAGLPVCTDFRGLLALDLMLLP